MVELKEFLIPITDGKIRMAEYMICRDKIGNNKDISISFIYRAISTLLILAVDRTRISYGRCICQAHFRDSVPQ